MSIYPWFCPYGYGSSAVKANKDIIKYNEMGVIRDQNHTSRQMAHVRNAKKVCYEAVSMSLSKSSPEVAPLAIFLSIILMASDMSGINGVPSQDPTAISALKV